MSTAPSLHQFTNPPDMSDAEFEDALSVVPSAVLPEPLARAPEPVGFHIAPPWGWDHKQDVLRAQKYCHDNFGRINAGEPGIQQARGMFDDLRDMGISPKLAVKLIWTLCKPPQNKSEIAHQAYAAYDTPTHMPALKSFARPLDAADWTPADADEEETFDRDWLEPPVSVWPRPVLYDPERHNRQLAEAFLQERPARLICSDQVLYSLDDGKVWREVSKEELAAEIDATDPGLLLDTRRILGIVESIKLRRMTTARPFEWIDEPHDAPLPENSILFRNGVLDFATGELRPHDGRYFATGLPAFDFDPAAACPTWEKCLSEWLHESYHATLYEFAGYLMTNDTRTEKLLALIGATRGGKSTIMKVLQALVGSAHCASRSLQHLGGEFGLEGLLDRKLLTIPDAVDADLSKRGNALATIKAVTGRDEVSVNRKTLKIITARLPTRLVLVANRHPKFLDEGGALAEREIVLRFETTFKGREDTHLFEKLHAELSGVANKALEALGRSVPTI